MSMEREEDGERLTDGDSPTRWGLDLLHAQVDQLSEEDTESDGELVHTYERASTRGRSAFG